MPTMRVRGIFGRPYVDLGARLDLSPLARLHDEICLGLAQLPVDYTGGSHRSMGIVPPSRRDECHIDYGEAIRAMSDDQFATLVELADAGAWSPPAPAGGEVDLRRLRALQVGEERDLPLSRRQMLWLKYRFGVYFPWKVYVELVPNRWWGEKSQGEGKSFTRLARAFFPQTVAWIEGLPLSTIGRVTIMGLEANDHGTVHHDGEPACETPPDHFVSFCPMGNKRVFLWEEETQRKIPIAARAYWFNDQDDHGVEADPFFRYSIRVDGVFQDDFLAGLRDQALSPARPKGADSDARSGR
jgi:hypothetical protein